MFADAIGDIVDLQRHSLAGPDNTIIESAAVQYRRDGTRLLPGFFRPGGINAMAAVVENLQGKAFRCDDRHNTYLKSMMKPVPKSSTAPAPAHQAPCPGLRSVAQEWRSYQVVSP